MYKFILAFSLFVLYSVTAEALEEDKFKHGSISLGFGAVATRSVEEAFPEFSRTGRWMAGTTLAMIPGVAKEMTDVRFDNADIAADFVGSVLGVLLSDLTGGRVLMQVGEETFFIGLRFGGGSLTEKPDLEERLALNDPFVAN